VHARGVQEPTARSQASALAALVLVVEDEVTLAQTIELYLRNEGYRTERAFDGERALELFRAAKPDLVLLDIGLPKIDGLEVLRVIRTLSDVPVVVLTARSEEVDELVGLGMGASDYLVKPVSARKLMARVKVALRHARPGADPSELLRVGPLEVDGERVQARVHGTALHLTPTEFKLLQHLARTPRRVIGRSELYEAALPEGDALERAVDIHITNLRRKLRERGAADLIDTVRGVGYVLDAA
jgi:two-component system, OmpR family, response regulator AdeR